ncbi:hypothetical protein NEF87_004816 [Candidatus Lokiarchaeum ossiferum]|uniref:Transcription regulator TrmB N-terminal domain-containing protein n=1 Tax=Candidatus Lokiarchaeum ossiferum TaxID=2951803 RepID=A0ABY6HYW4_9ARCH|nr:hypothetical protein NEF87_004816 [Candidatus Lokiarchaeum sp. B-35]
MENQNPFSKLVDLFDAIDINEKGIEIVYDYLIKNHTIEDPKSIYQTLGLSLKRIYKIFSVLKDLELVQVYSRPMKVILNDPITSWEKIVSDKIKQIRIESNEKITNCEMQFKSMIDSYNLIPEQPSLPPVEYINILGDNEPIDFINNELLGGPEKNIFISKGLRVKIDFIEHLYSLLSSKAYRKKNGYANFGEILEKWNKDFPNHTFNVLLSEEYLEETILKIAQTKIDPSELKILTEKMNPNIEVRVSQNTIGNFIIKEDEELLQYSVDPSNTLLGAFISRQKEIIDVFSNKFSEMYSQSVEISQFFKDKKKPQLTLLEKIAYALF